MKANKSKSIVLAVLLLLPVLIFLFLKYFGNNEFSIPIYYEEGVGDTLAGDCVRGKGAPYTLFTKPASQIVHKIYHFEKSEGANLAFRLEELERVQDALSENSSVLLFSFLNSPTITRNDLSRFDDRIAYDPTFWSIRSVDSTSYNIFKNCELVMNETDDRVVLVDKEERIRGYYDINDREETDRLILELKILLRKDQ